jgi:DNA-binding transcriptional LysR family regulator
MELTPLRYFQVVARAGTLTAASRILGVTQPTLTLAMRQLERELGTTLLLRDRRGITLTATGKELLHYAAEILSLCDLAQERVLGLETEHVGHFVIGCPDALGAYFLPDFLKSFFAAWPRIQLSLWNAPSRQVEQAVVERRVHFGLVVNPLPHPDLVLTKLFNDSTEVLATKHLRSQAKDVHALLRRGPLIYVAGLPQTEQIVQELGERKLLPDRQLPCGDLELVRSLTLHEVGVGLLPRRVAEHGHKGSLQPLAAELPSVEDQISLAFRADLHRSRAANRVKETLVAHGRTFVQR